MTEAALARMANWEADKEKGSKIVWCWTIKGYKFKKDDGSAPP